MISLDYADITLIDEMETHAERVHAAATLYANNGFHVIPVRRNQKAIPPSSMNCSYRNATDNVGTVDKWFGPEGKFRGWNVGLACGADNGIFVIDVDTNPEKDGRPAFKAMAEDFGEFKGMIQNTPSGGIHVVYQWFNGGTSSTDKLARGIDTRGGKGHCSSHIVAWPSEIDGKRYTWKRAGVVPEVPDFILEMMGTPWEAPDEDLGNENLTDADLETKFTKRQIWDMLCKIDPNEMAYDEWLNIGMAIHSQHPDEDGFKMWDKWSSEGARYEADECSKRWHAFKPYGPVRIGTLIHHAKAGGYMPTPQMASAAAQEQVMAEADEYTQMIEEMNEQYGVVLVGGKIRIMAQALNQDPDQDLTLLNMEDFRTLCMNNKIVVNGAQGQPKVVSKAAMWMADERRKDFMGGIDFRPDKELEYDTPNGRAMNLWRGWAKTPKKGDWSKLRAHIEDIVCSGNEEYYTWVLDWMADLFQDPANPKGAALVMHGLEGCGKGTVIEAMGRCMGRHYKHLVHEKHLTGEFNGHMQDALLVFADELVYGGSKKTAGALKSLVTERMLMTERKGVDAQRGRNCAHLAIASNESWFIPAGPESRRWFVLEVSPAKCMEPSWFDAIYEEMDNGGIEAMMHDLLEREITTNLKRAPETESLAMQRALYSDSVRDSVYDWWQTCLEHESVDVACLESESLDQGWPILVIKPELYDAYERWCGDKRIPSHQVSGKEVFYMKMGKMGLGEKTPKAKAVVNKAGGRKRCFVIPDHATAVKEMTKYVR